MPMQIGRIPYLSCEPFYFEMERRGMALRELVPSALVAAAAQGEIDAGPVPLAACASLAEQFRFLSGFCVATIRKASSVSLHSQRPIEALTEARIGVTGDAVTARRLLQVVLALKHHVQTTTYVTLDEPHEAFLLVGNEALRQRGGTRAYPHIYDLGEEWHQWTDLPFVFARWMVRKELDRKAVAMLEDALYVGMQDWADGLFRPAPARDDILMHPRDILEYTQGIRYFIGVTEQRAMDRFHQYLDQLNIQ